MKHIVFVGPMGSGKSTIGVRVAAALGRPFIDNDERLERATGHTAEEIAARDGVPALHRAEASVLLDALREKDPSVIAAAASTISDADVRRELGAVSVVWLRAQPASLAVRMPDSTIRPFRDQDPARLALEQASERDQLFSQVADFTFDTDVTGVETVVAAVLGKLAET